MLFNCGAGEDSWVSLVKQGVQTTLSQRTSTLNIHWKDWCWSRSSNTLATWREEPTHWKRPWCWERWRAGREEVTEDEMVGWYHQHNRQESEQTQGDGEGQGNLACCRSEVTKSQTQLSYWTRPKMKWHYVFLLMKSISILGLWAKSSLFGYPVFQQTTYSIKERVKKKMHTQTCLL